MAFQIINFMLGRVMAEREGVTDSAAVTRLALLGAMMESPIMGAIITQQLARREVETTAPAAEVEIAVPDVTGLSVEAAQNQLSTAGFATITTTVQQNAVVSQEPAPGAFEPPGSAVTLSVSLGVEVPDLTGKLYTEASSLLRSMKLVAARQEEFSDTVEKNQVVEQSPVKGTLIAEGGSVVLSVSKGPSGGTKPVLAAEAHV